MPLSIPFLHWWEIHTLSHSCGLEGQCSFSRDLRAAVVITKDLESCQEKSVFAFASLSPFSHHHSLQKHRCTLKRFLTCVRWSVQNRLLEADTRCACSWFCVVSLSSGFFASLLPGGRKDAVPAQSSSHALCSGAPPRPHEGEGQAAYVEPAHEQGWWRYDQRAFSLVLLVV